MNKFDHIGLGVFDGLHIGHQAFFNTATTLLCIHPHPEFILSQTPSIKYITTINELQFINSNIQALEFTKDIAGLSPLDFLNEIIKKKYNPKSITVGYDFMFGKKKQGNTTLLNKWCSSSNIDLHIVNCVTYQHHPVKSGWIRNLINLGKFEKAITLLGHPYIIQGQVIPGDNRGRELGYPTCNIKPAEHKLIPQPGVYNSNITIDNTTHQSISYIGNKPTFKNGFPSIETHIYDFNENLYDKHVTVSLTAKIRDEHTFKNSDELVRQIKADIQKSQTLHQTNS